MSGPNSYFVKGGGNAADVFRGKDSGTAYSGVEIDGSTAITDVAGALFRLDRTIKTSFKPDSNEVGVLSWDQERLDKEISDALEVLAVKGTAGQTEPERYYEDGDKQGGAGSSTGAPIAFAIVYGKKGKDGLIPCVGVIGNFPPDVRAFDWEDGAITKPAISLNGFVAEYDFDIKAFLDTTIVTVPTTFKILKSKTYVFAFLTPAA